jgi:amino acid adenylation domain-containing protein
VKSAPGPRDQAAERTLGAGQLALWHQHCLSPQSPAYNVIFAARVTSAVEEGAMAQATADLIARHPLLTWLVAALPGPYPARDGTSGAGRSPVFGVVDADGADEDRLCELARECAREPFRLPGDLPVRVRLLRASPRSWALVVAVHHMVADNSSMRVLTDDLLALYAAARGECGPPPVAACPYEDFTALEHEYLASQEAAEAHEFWRRRFEAGLPDSTLPPVLDGPPGHGSTYRLVLPAKAGARARELAGSYGVSPFVFHLAVCELLLHRVSGQDELTIGCATSVRPAAGFDDSIGYFVNLVMLRSRLGTGDSLGSLVSRADQELRGALRHRRLPFSAVARDLGARGARPLRLAFNYRLSERYGPLLHQQDMAGVPGGPALVELAGLEVRPLHVPQQDGQRDLLLEVLDASAGLVVEVKYDEGRYDADWAERLARRYQCLLDDVLARTGSDGEPLAADLAVIPETEQRLIASCAGKPASAPGRPLHERVADWAAEAPERAAVQSADGTVLTYRDLDDLAWRWAGLLTAHGVRPGSIVAVLATASGPLLPAIIGLWRAGGIYLPLDPSYPRDRLRFMVSDAGATVMLAQDPASEIAATFDGTVLPAVEQPRAGARPGAGAADVHGEIAYLIYTSGSTGRPKGVLVGHPALANLAAAQQRLLGTAPEDRVLQFAPLSFDASVWELALAFGAGACLSLPRGGAPLVGDILAGALRDTGATIVTLPPSALGTVRPGDIPGVRTVVVAGEECPPDLVAEWAAEVRLVNAYGPTEATVCATAHFCRPGDEAGRVPIGRPLDGVRVHVLDAALRPVPVGTAGELVVGGAGVSHGYHQRPELTSERFVTAPALPGERLYRTGDTARLRADGALEFLGRADLQVKVRGFRVELTEVESALLRVPGVRGAAVSADDGRLVAVLARHGGPEIPGERLRAALGRWLPSHMVPDVVIWVDRLPVLPNGKTDRGALPRPEPAVGESAARPDDRAAGPAPDLEAGLARLWSELLGVPAVGRHDDFFRLGGHSLLAARLVRDINRRFGTEAGLRDLYDEPTVAGLARVIANSRPPVPESDGAVPRPATPPPAADEAHAYEPFPLTSVQRAYLVGRDKAIELGGVSAHGYFEIDCGPADLSRLEDAWNRVVAQHPMLRAVISPDGTQRVNAQMPRYQIRVHDLCSADPAAVNEHVTRTRDTLSHQVLPAETGPLFDIVATRYSSDRVLLHVSLDGLIMDARSLAVVFGDWVRFYRDPGLAPAAQRWGFRDYVLALQRHADSPEYARSRDYWRERLASLPPSPDLPRAGQEPDSGDGRHRFVQLTHAVPAERWTRIRDAAAAHGVSPSAALLACFADVLSRWSGSSHFCVNLTLFNRLPLHPDVGRLVGDFTALSLLEVDFRPAGSFAERARRIQRQLFTDLDQAGYSGADVLRDLARERGQQPGAQMPVVFTSALGVADGPEGWGFDQLGDLVYGSAQTSQVLLDHVVYELNGELTLVWNAVADAFPPGLVSDMLAAYTAAVARLAQSRAWTAEALVLLPTAQRSARLAVNATAAESGSPELLHEGFVRRALGDPAAVAIITEDGEITYGRLLELAAVVRAELLALGLQPGDRVAVTLPKGWRQVAALLGTSLAGGAYVPVEPAMPADRRVAMARDAGCRLALTIQALASGPGWPEGIRLACLPDRPDQLPVPVPGSPGAGPAVPGGLAYIIYTSGSTGRPKGVMLTHGAVVNTLRDVNRRFAVGPRDRVLAVSEISFDLSVFDVFGVLGAGGAIVLPNPERKLDPAHWNDLMLRYDVTIWNSVPALAELLPEAGPPGALRLAMLSGDWIPLPLPGRLRARWPRLRVVGLGGATECAIWSVQHEIGEIDPAWPSIPYGRPLANQTVHVLDSSGRDCPDWVPGDLYIGGAGLTQGYVADEDLTASRLIPGRADGGVGYRTGDVARFRPGGELEFLGRTDAQVKINGHRIELGEVESALLRHPGVRRAAVTVGRERRSLVGHVVPAEGGPLLAAAEVAAGRAAARHAALREAADSESHAPYHQAALQRFAPFAAAVEAWAALAVRATLAAADCLGQPGRELSAAEAAARLGADGRFAELIARWLAALADAGQLARRPGGRFAATHTCDLDAVAAAWRNVREAALGGLVSESMVGYLAASAAHHLPLLRGELHPLELYGANDDVARTLYRNNPVREQVNATIRATVRELARLHGDSRPLRIMEVGAGDGSVTEGFLGSLLTVPASYLVTDVSPVLAGKARARLGGLDFVGCGVLDIEQDPVAQGYAEHDFDAVIAGNVLHAVSDPARALSGIRRLLAPGGHLLLAEGTAPSLFELVSVAFLENADEAPAAAGPRPLEFWRAALAQAGLADTAAFPRQPGPVPSLAQHVLLARGPARVTRFQTDMLRDHLASALPLHMVPTVILRHDQLPLSGNGKVDRSRLPQPPPVRADRERAGQQPGTPVERDIAIIWQELLGSASRMNLGDSLFALGGDSLTATRLSAQIRARFQVEVTLREIFENHRLGDVAELVANRMESAGSQA